MTSSYDLSGFTETFKMFYVNNENETGSFAKTHSTWKRNSFFDFFCPLVEVFAEGSNVDASLTELWAKWRTG